jgi:hypothetical protein
LLVNLEDWVVTCNYFTDTNSSTYLTYIFISHAKLFENFFQLHFRSTQPRCPTNDEWIKKMWYLYAMEFYSAIKKNDIMFFVGKWMELENINLSEVSHPRSESQKLHVLSHMWNTDNTNIRNMKNKSCWK